MIILKRLKWGNFRSYGENNYLDLHTRVLTQLLGDNGAGKTTIPLMLQEVLYGKNVKGIKKEGLSNRYTKEVGYWIKLSFSRDSDEYVIDLNRNKTKVTVKLSENGLDVSSHTATNTYKTIANILGIPDFKTFCQLTYQSTTDALDFLTATDTTRKRFLISLLDFSQYLKYHEVLKLELKGVNKSKSEVVGAIDASNSWLHKYAGRDLTKMKVKQVPQVPTNLLDEMQACQEKLDSITTINKLITSNNKYRKDVEKLGDITSLPAIQEVDTLRLKELNIKLSDIRGECSYQKKILRELNVINTKPSCHACGRDMPFEDVSTQKEQTSTKLKELSGKVTALSEQIQSIEQVVSINKTTKRKLQDYEYCMSKVDLGLSRVTLDESELIQESFRLSRSRVEITATITKAIKYNTEATAHNATVEAIKEQIQDFKAELSSKQEVFKEIEKRVAYLTILKDVFSTNGLVSYKVEASVKVLETSINSYLAEFSEFRIRFKLVGDKLNVEVFDNFRNIIDIQTVSTGELGRINLATSLAIRKLLSTLTATRLNFFFVDEITGVLDASGKETLFDMLQREDLNTIMVAHEETHPLIPKIEINKINNISELKDE